MIGQNQCQKLFAPESAGHWATLRDPLPSPPPVQKAHHRHPEVDHCHLLHLPDICHHLGTAGGSGEDHDQPNPSGGGCQGDATGGNDPPGDEDDEPSEQEEEKEEGPREEPNDQQPPEQKA
ncbi:hypothetical protein LSTR_LSTR011362 [Laodelphax striatellus]|uniref:Uncharacterized protein n=1 Tax=Laodelphax striatellus TaxID=195883 RepID=A0A482WVG4_LAOST|nr:hypothetical protein LSTR_LSTR011362 [Laodelphax striatellus]